MKHLTRSLLILCFALPVVAQVPSLTTEDVLKWRAANPERAKHFIPKTAASAQPAQKSQAQSDAEYLRAEKEWNIRLNEARTRVRDFERRADQAELQATQARNVNIFGSADQVNANNANIGNLRATAQALRAEARYAQQEVDRLLDEGKQYGFQLNFISPVLKNGAPNLEYFRTRYLDLAMELQDAQSRAAVLQLRTNRLQTSINNTLSYNAGWSNYYRGILFYPNTGAADVFYLNRLRNELAYIGGDANSNAARIQILQQELADLIEEGRRAGVPPGTFR